MPRIIAQVRRILVELALNRVAGSVMFPLLARGRLLDRFGLEVGPGVRVNSGCWFTDTDVAIGARSFVNSRCYFDATARIEVGEDCALGIEVLLCTGTHQVGDARARAGADVHGPITIGDGVWVGARVTVLPGITIGDGCVIGAGALVTRDCAPHGLYVGAPARRVRELPTPGEASP